jgi:hypothetical protein
MTDRVSVDELNTLAAELEELNEHLAVQMAHSVEQRRRRDLLAGITPIERKLLDIERQNNAVAITAKLKAENDQLETELNRRRGLVGPSELS